MSTDKDVRQPDEGWYVRELSQTNERQLWRVTSTTATRMGVTSPELGPGSFYEAEPGEAIWAAINRMTGWMDGLTSPRPFHRITLGPGRYYPRIARPYALMKKQMLRLPEPQLEQRYLASASNQLDALIDSLKAICRVVQPAPATLSVYGHEIRNLLILASTEAEMHWRGVLAANGASDRSGTTHYVSLVEPLKLRDYRVRFHASPGIEEIGPFANWDAAAPSQSIPWYAAYNGVKHNREFEFEKATLANAFGAIAACAVMLVAQFGEAALSPDVRRFMGIAIPEWRLEEMYLMPEESCGWRREMYPALG